MDSLKIKIDKKGNVIKTEVPPKRFEPTDGDGENKDTTPPPHTNSESETKSDPPFVPKNYTPYIIGGVAVIVVIALLFCLKPWDKKPPIPPIDTRLQQLIQNGENVFKTKNVARAKKVFQDALIEYPENQEILKRIEKCDSIIRSASYSSLKAERGISPSGEQNKLGFADNQGYIVIDFLYDEEISRFSEMIALKNGGQCGVIGGELKDGVSEFKYTEVLPTTSVDTNYYRLINFENGSFISDDKAIIKNEKLIICKLKN